MKFDEFTRRAVASLAAAQLENGSWLNDEPATCAAIEAFTERMLGAEAVCRHSMASPIGVGAWPLSFSLGLLSGRPASNENDQRLAWAAIAKGFNIIADRDDDGPYDVKRLWIDSRWLSLGSLLDYDFRPDIPLATFRVPYHSLPPWLAAQVALAVLHNDPSFLPTKERFFEEKLPVVDAAAHLLGLVFDDHWSCAPISDEECTAIVGQFLFHRCMRHLLGEMQRDAPSAKLKSLLDGLSEKRQPVLDWILSRQDAWGAWAESAHVTSHCARLLLQILSDHDGTTAGGAAVRDRAVVLDATKRAVTHLLAEEQVRIWESFYSYQHMEIFTTLMRAADSPELHGAFDADVPSRMAVPDVFLSYGGCDREFARWLASGIEEEGLRVWFAEWDLDYGMDVVSEIEGALDVARNVLVVISPEALKRPWVKREISAALNDAISKGKKRVIPVVLEPAAMPGFLRALRFADLTDPATRTASRAALISTLRGKRPSRR